jgi:hypothetical protein
MAPAWQRQSLAWAEEKKGCYQSFATGCITVHCGGAVVAVALDAGAAPVVRVEL